MPITFRTNTSSLEAQRNLGANQHALNGAMGKLSSGYRITRAADDAAGLAISEKLRSRIIGTQNNLEFARITAQRQEGLLLTGDISRQAFEDATARALDLDEDDLPQDVDTIGGLILKRLARQPARGDRVDVGRWTATVEGTQGFRILALTFRPRSQAGASSAPEPAEAGSDSVSASQSTQTDAPPG